MFASTRWQDSDAPALGPSEAAGRGTSATGGAFLVASADRVRLASPHQPAGFFRSFAQISSGVVRSSFQGGGSQRVSGRSAVGDTTWVLNFSC